MKAKCDKHPKYKGKVFPSYDCSECIGVWWDYNFSPPRIPVAPPAKVFKDKKKYTRKTKHKVKE